MCHHESRRDENETFCLASSGFGSSGASAPDPFRCACVVESEAVQEDWHLGAFP